MHATVKVMRSYDYCHFEVSLSADDAPDLDAVDELRKQAAVLVDEAVRQYKTAKKKESLRESREWEIRDVLDRVGRIKAKPESDWSIEDAALVRAAADQAFWKGYDEDAYCYSDPERDFHFSMLRQFHGSRKTRVKAG